MLQLDQPGPRPVWAVIDAARERQFTGELTLHFDPPVHVYAKSGEIHLVEREGDPSIEDRLVTQGLITPDELERGVVAVAGIRHLGRLFDRVPGLDRDAIEISVDLYAAQALGEIAHLIVDQVTIANYRFHPSGLHHWWTRTAEGAPASPPTDVTVVRPEVEVGRGFDLEHVIEVVGREPNAWSADDAHDADDDVPEDVKAAVRLALAEIEAATRPLITAGLSMATFLTDAVTSESNPTLTGREPSMAATPSGGVGLRRLIGGVRSR
jgi:hypothetical protein